MANTKEFFLSVSQRIFSNWMALKMAVEHGMGSKENALEFSPYITELMYMNEGLNAQEVALELEDYMDVHFNTELQDNSSQEVAEELLRFHQYCVQGNETLATEEYEKLPPLQSWFMSREEIIKTRHPQAPVDAEGDSSEDEEEGVQAVEIMEDEWTEVKTRRKR